MDFKLESLCRSKETINKKAITEREKMFTDHISDKVLIPKYIKNSYNSVANPQTIRLKMDQFSSVHFSRSVVSDSLRPHESQHARPPCPSPSPGVHPNSRPSSRWCHPAISSSVIPFSSCPQSLPASEYDLITHPPPKKTYKWSTGTWRDAQHN